MPGLVFHIIHTDTTISIVATGRRREREREREKKNNDTCQAGTDLLEICNQDSAGDTPLTAPARWLGDGDCDDAFNCEAYGFDNGDCESSPVLARTSICHQLCRNCRIDCCLSVCAGSISASAFPPLPNADLQPSSRDGLLWPLRPCCLDCRRHL